MEPNKLENDIREKLSSREMQPSTQAWDRLDAMLSMSEIKKEKKKMPWLYIAAGLIFFMGIAFLYVNTENNPAVTLDKSPEVVVGETEANKEQGALSTQEPGVNQAASVTQSNPAHGTKYADVTSKSGARKMLKTSVVKTENRIENTLEEIKYEEKNEALAQQNAPTQTKEMPVYNASGNNMILPEKVEKNKPKLKVDAASLLSQVEDEAELTFRQKAIKVITKNYKNAKESLATRNVEQSSY